MTCLASGRKYWGRKANLLGAEGYITHKIIMKKREGSVERGREREGAEGRGKER